jgi:hypothetical protein
MLLRGARVPIFEFSHSLFVRRIKTRQLPPFQHAFEDPPLQRLHLPPCFDHVAHHRWRNYDRAILVGDDDVIRKDRDTAASDRLLPINESQLCDRRGGEEMPEHQIGRPVFRIPSRSRIAPSVTKPSTPRRTMRAQRMSPKIPASVTPPEDTTATLPFGISSIAYRVERVEESDAGVARSSLPEQNAW